MPDFLGMPIRRRLGLAGFWRVPIFLDTHKEKIEVGRILERPIFFFFFFRIACKEKIGFGKRVGLKFGGERYCMRRRHA